MKIDNVESLVLGGALFVRITTDTGLVGLGQTACWAYPAAVDQVVQTFRSYLVGQDPMRIEHHWQYLYRMGPFRGSVLSGAVSAIDIALWDIKGQHFQAPIWELLGGRCRDRVRLHLLMGGGTAEQVATSARAAAAEGFTAIKFDPVPPGFQDLTLDGAVGPLRVRLVEVEVRVERAESDRRETGLGLLGGVLRERLGVFAGDVDVAADPIAGLAAHQVVDRHAEPLPLDVPERDVDRRERPLHHRPHEVG